MDQSISTSLGPWHRSARVYLVGAGPGDPGLLTVRGLECLRRAEVVIYDYLANEELLEHTPQAAEKVCLGRHGHGRLMTQQEANRRMVQAAQAGQTVVRLKGGDPAVFARLAEELSALEEAQIPYEIVPGITALLAASSYAGLPITDRHWASSVALITGQETEQKAADASGPHSPAGLEALARFPGTLVYYMGVTTAGRWSVALIQAGKPAETPVAIIRRCSCPDQQIYRCRLDEVAETLNQRKPDKIRPPVLVIIGPVANLEAASGDTPRQSLGASWFTRRPLFGQTVMITRPAEQGRELREVFRELGASVVLQPTIEISPPPDWGPVDEVLSRLGEFHWLVFTSSNGVRYFLSRLLEGQGDLRALGSVKFAAVGPGTAAELRRWHLKADVVPEQSRAEALADALSQMGGPSPTRVLLLRASRGREVLAERLTQAGWQVDQVVVYNSTDVDQPTAEASALIEAGQVDWVTVTSSAIAGGLVRLFGERLRSAQMASISPITSQTLRQFGYEPAVEARHFTMQGVVQAILGARQQFGGAQPG